MSQFRAPAQPPPLHSPFARHRVASWHSAPSARLTASGCWRSGFPMLGRSCLAGWTPLRWRACSPAGRSVCADPTRTGPPLPPGVPPGGRPSRAPVLSQPLFSCVFSNPWVESTRLVVKPDQVIKRRGKAGLLLLNATWAEVQEWVNARIGREITVGGVCGPLTNFIVEPFLPHAASDEYYVCVQSHRFGEEVLFYHEVRPSCAAFPSPNTCGPYSCRGRARPRAGRRGHRRR